MAGKNASSKATKQQSTAAAAGSPERPAPKKQAVKRSPRKHPGSEGPVEPNSKRAKGDAHPFAFLDEDIIEDPEKEGDPTC